VGGTLLVQAALAAAGTDDSRRADELTERAAGVAANLRGYDDQHRTSFGPIVVELARVLVAASRGDAVEALRRHSAVVRREAWRRNPWVAPRTLARHPGVPSVCPGPTGQLLQSSS
jgi:hypothetical protein